MLVTDKYAYTSKLAKKDPLAKVIFTFAVLFLCLVLNNVFVSIFLLIFFAGFTIISKAPCRKAIFIRKSKIF